MCEGLGAQTWGFNVLGAKKEVNPTEWGGNEGTREKRGEKKGRQGTREEGECVQWASERVWKKGGSATEVFSK